MSVEARWRRIASFLERTLQLSREAAILKARLMSSEQLTEHYVMMLQGLSPTVEAIAIRKLRTARRKAGKCTICEASSITRLCPTCNADRQDRWKRSA